MKVIDCSPVPQQENRFTTLKNQIATRFKISFLMNSETQAQENLITQLSRLLSNKFTIVRNASLAGAEEPIPMILLGPAGVFVFHPNLVKGVFRAKNDTWSVMGRSQDFIAARPNLIQQTQGMARAVNEFLSGAGCQGMEAQPILLFMNPGTHVDSIRPAIRIVLVDGLDHFANSLMQEDSALPAPEVQRLITLLTEPPPPTPEPEVDLKAAPQKERSFQPPKILQSPMAQKLASASRSVHMTRGQIIYLVVLAALLVIVLIMLILVVLLLA